MFNILNVIEKTLKRQHLFLLLTVILSFFSVTIITIFYLSHTFSNKKVVYALDNAGNAIVLKEVEENPLEEAKGHYKDFHLLFFSFPPEGKQIQANIDQALYLVDESGRTYYNTFKENHYYNKLVASNTSQSIIIDSISVTTRHPYQARLHGRLFLVRATMLVERSLITTGQLRRTQRTENNPHGFIIEKFKIVELKDIKTYTRE